MHVSTQVFLLLNIRAIMPPWLSIHQIVFFRSWLHVKCHLVKVMSVFMSSSRVKHFIYPALVKPSEQLAATIEWHELLVLHHLNTLVVKYWCTDVRAQIWNICARTSKTFHILLYVAHVQPTHAAQCWMVCQPYKQCSSCSCGSWLSGFPLSKEIFQCWQMDDRGKRNGAESLHAHTQTQWPYFERAENKF